MSFNLEFENITPWNGANDTGKDVRLKWQHNLEKISENFTQIDKVFQFLEYDETNKAIKVNGNLYAMGGLTAQGQGKNTTGGTGGVSAFKDLVDISLDVLSDGDIIYYDKESSHWKNRAGNYYAKNDDLTNLASKISTLNNYTHPTYSPINAGGTRNFLTGFITDGLGHVTNVTTAAMTKGDITDLWGATIWDSNNFNPADKASATGLNSFITRFSNFFLLSGSGTDADPYTVKVNGNLYTTGGLAALGQGKNATGGGGVSALADCVDVDFSTLADGDFIYYDLALKRWKNRPENYFAKKSDLNMSNWNDAYNWGNHALAGYLKSYTESDPIFKASAAYGITGTLINNWTTAYNWGNHANVGYALASSLANYLSLNGGTLSNRLQIIKTLGGNNASDLQHLMQFEIKKLDDEKALAIGVLDNGVGVIQAKESGVGYQALLLNPVSGNVGINLGGTGIPTHALEVNGEGLFNGWIRTQGNVGWYNETYQGGWYMSDSTWIRAWNSKNVYTPGAMRADGGFQGNLDGQATSISGFTSSNASSSVDTNNATSNGLYYYTANGPSGMSTNDGGLYVQAYNTSWVGQIAQDYRNGRLAVRGKNDGTWTTWLHVLDEANYNAYVPSLTGAGASGSWNIIANKSEYIGNDSQYMRFHWNGQGGQPSWLWGGNDAGNMYVWNPANFHVSDSDRVYPISSNPNNSHPGYGLRVFYSWNIGQAKNDSAGYSNGITIGSNTGDTAYGFQIVQNMWDDNLYFRRYNSGWQSWQTVYSTANFNPGNYLPLTGGTLNGSLTVNGNILATGGVTALSDMRYKHVIRKRNIKLADIAKAPLFDFTLKIGKDDATHIGTSAQYWQEILPQVIRENKDMLSMDYASAALACCISMSREIVKLKKRLQEYELR